VKDLVLNELKVYTKEVNSRSIQGVRSSMKKKGLHGFADHFYSKKSKHPLSECSEYYLDDKDFITKAIKLDPNSIKFASKTLRQDKQIAKLILKKDKKLANKYIFKKTLLEIR
jgi:hypothetical protein